MKEITLFLCLALFCWTCSPDDGEESDLNLPTLIVNDLTLSEINQDTIIDLNLRLERAAADDIFLSFATIEGSAKGGVDFTPIRDGTVFFPTGSQEKTIPLTIIGDEIAEDEESFGIVLLSISNAKLGKERVSVIITDDD